jgi:hypothetical protein
VIENILSITLSDKIWANHTPKNTHYADDCLVESLLLWGTVAYE